MLKIHFITGRRGFWSEDIFACGLHQPMIPLRATTERDKVTCLACLKRMKP